MASEKDDAGEDGSGSSGSLVEVKLNEYVKKSELTKLDIRALVVRCSSCGSQINHVSTNHVKKHRKLGVITCKDCYEYYGSSEFSQDENGLYNYCRWCGKGGKLIVCDFCPNAFCGACIRRNFGRSEISETEKDGWKCYCCDGTRLKSKQEFCDVIIDYQKKDNKVVTTKVKKEYENTLSETWLQIAFDDSNDSCKTFLKKLTRLKSIGIAKSKSMKHVVSKMEQVINQHKKDLKNIVKSLSEQYSNYIELKKAEEAKINQSNNCLDESSNSPRGLDNKDSKKDSLLNTHDCASIELKSDNNADLKDADNDCVIIEDTPEKTNVINITASSEENDKNDKMHEKDEKVDEKDEKVDEKTKAKLLLLQSSSDSDSHDQASPLVKDSPSPAPTVVEDVPVASPVESQPDLKPSDSGMNAKRTLIFDSDSTASSDFDTINIKRRKSGINKSKANGVELPQINSDTKLKSQTIVEIKRCDNLLKNGETTVKISSENDTADEAHQLDKEILSLCKLPTLHKKSSVQQKTTSAKPKSKAAPKAKDDSSSSISLSSDDEEDQLKAPIKSSNVSKNDTLKAKADLMVSDSNSSDINLESEEEEKTKKTKKLQKKEQDSSDDFQPRKRRKYDKLLDAPLPSDDEKDKKPKKKREKKTKKRKILSSDEEKNEKSRQANSGTTSSSTSSDSEDELRKKSRKQSKKRRVKTMDESSSEDKDKQGDTPSGKGRKNIKKIISEKKLEKSTKEAQLEEKERRRRIEDRQKLYNKIVDTSLDGKEIITRKMVLEVDQDSKVEVVEIHPDLVCKLKPHQVNGVKFMWECTIESTKDLNKPGSGCILAHCMGLGKSLQVIAFLHTCLTNPIVGKTITRGMVICPYNTCLNWAHEFDYWLHDVEFDVKIHQLTETKSNIDRYEILKYWFNEGGVVILSYDIFRRLSLDKIPKLKAREKKLLHTYILDPGPDIVVCDEGHILKNEASAISKATAKLKTSRRIVLTGTPLQNNLREYHCMLSFVKPNLLGTSKEFRNRFVNPIINGQHADSNDYDVKLMKKRIHILHKLLDGCVQRCDYLALTKFLPPKHEFVISVKLSEIQVKMYECYLEKLTLAKKDMKSVGSTLFIDFNNLRCIWNHPYICHTSHQKQEFKRLFKDDAEDDEEFIDDGSLSENESSKDEKSSENSAEEVVRDYKTRSRRGEAEDDDEDVEEIIETEKQWYHEFISDEDRYNIELSGKMVLLMDILKECEAIGDKIIVFSQSLLAIDAIEDLLEHIDSLPVSDSDKNRDVVGRWVKGIDYFRMDGTTNAGFRKSYIHMFNNPSNVRARLFLISTRAGSLGTNLVGANRVIVFDTSWNPSHDVQAIFRVYRFGQIKPVYIYRFLAQGTMEEKIYDRQVTKLSLSCRVVDEQQIERHFSAADLAELYMFDRNSTTNRPTPMLPKDRLLAEMLIKNKDWIVTYHEHDSLLQNQTEEDLTEEERQAAWTEYENEREGKTDNVNAGFASGGGNAFCSEPDFTSEDYEGKKIPDLRTIMETLYTQLSLQMPGQHNSLDFRKKLLVAVFKVRQVFQEKHVKVLRLKQELVARGSVPNAVNKYIDELSSAIQSTGEYIQRLQKNIEQDETKEKATKMQWQEQLKRMHQTRGMNFQNMTNMQNQQGMPRFQQARFPFRMTMPQNAAFVNQRFVFASAPRNVYRGYTRTAEISKPTITEVDENASEPATDASSTPTNTTSTVVIEEIA